MPKHRLLFTSIHSYIDPSSGVALATRKLLELMAARGWVCRALTCGVLDYAQETPLEDVLATIDLPGSALNALDLSLTRPPPPRLERTQRNGDRQSYRHAQVIYK